MTFIEIYCILFFLSVLALQPIYSAAKYVVPVLGFVILFVARGILKGINTIGKENGAVKAVGACSQPLFFILLAILLSNVAFITVSAIQQIKYNILYLQGDKYAGYDAKTRAMFEELETIDIPKGAEVFCRKPEFLYLIRGIRSAYPHDFKGAK